MAKFSLLVNGLGFDGSAHILTEDEVQGLRDCKDGQGYVDWGEMYSDLPTYLKDYDHYDTNFWVLSTALATESLHFVLIDQDENLVWDVKPEEFSDVNDETLGYEFPENAEDATKYRDAFPYEDQPNILLVYALCKGTLVDYSLESDEVPKPCDFSCTVHSIESPDGDFEYVDKVFYKGRQLEPVYEHENYTVKESIVQIFTLDEM
jgi:hypothetical protein